MTMLCSCAVYLGDISKLFLEEGITPFRLQDNYSMDSRICFFSFSVRLFSSIVSSISLSMDQV